MNFAYLKNAPDFAQLYTYCCEAEEFALSKPNISVTSARKAMEFIVKMIYSAVSGDIQGKTVFEMSTDYAFTSYLNDQILLNSIHFIRKMGNVAVHDGTLTSDEALKVLEELHFLVGEVCMLWQLIPDYPEFVKPTLQTPVQPEPTETPKAKVEVASELCARYAERMRTTRFSVAHDRDETENKKLFLRASLREAGWPIVNRANTAMPEAAAVDCLLDSGDSVDYVLYGRDNKPLAIIEQTATAKNLVEGRTKGIEKANQMAVKYGYKPVVYYTNGYYIYCIDQLGYPPRRVFNFHSIEELELLKLRRTMRQDIMKPTIDDNITNRDYQKNAIRSVCKAFTDMRRRSLLVMATGTGKTRVSISCVDVLMKANWVKNVLFLADRTSLVRQAHKNFNKLLPNVTTSLYTGGSLNRDANARVIFSTYQTMINLVNDDTREFGIGRFDLIIIDEAHRSIFKKYGSLFHYFDALMIGLTATPRCEENKSTYDTFQLENGKPDFAYELEAAIQDKYLVGFSVEDKTTDKMRRGIRYDDLTEEEKASFEDTFTDDSIDFIGTEIEGNKLGKNIINLGTIDAMLNDLMKNGLKVDGGDTLGKTIIFAASHIQAEKIVERFQKIYSQLGMDFCELIDSHVEGNLTLIEQFEVRGGMPQIAVSVDMMDTGIDVPDVVNLVFFKQVRSKIKFLQMIGRGTRLSPDLFGPGMNKQGFLIFDYYDNFRYFSTTGTWSTVAGSGTTINTIPQTVMLNKHRLGILMNLQQEKALCAFDAAYRDDLKAHFISETRSLNNDDIAVQYNMAYVSKYRTAEIWDNLTDRQAMEIEEHILPLFPSEKVPVKVKAFDNLIYVIEKEYPRREKEGKDARKIRNGFKNVDSELTRRMNALLKLKTIPAIVEKTDLIAAMIDGAYLLDHFSLERAENVRKALRDLMSYIPDKQGYTIINVVDWVEDKENSGTGGDKPYPQKAQEFLSGSNLPSLAKLRNLDPLTEDEKNELKAIFTSKLGTEAEFSAWAGSMALLPFLRLQVGISDEAIQTKFGSFLNAQTLNPMQLNYCQQIVDYARKNGDITMTVLLKESPFCDMDVTQIFGANIGYIKPLINGLHKPVM
jgi:type I restriction-modification system R subunit (endonuclease)